MSDRLVRFTQHFFDRPDELLPSSRGADGSPSATDFLLYDLPRIRDLLAADLDANLSPSLKFASKSHNPACVSACSMSRS